MTTIRPVYALIEWDGSYRPTVLAGCCWDSVLRDIIALFTALAATGNHVGSDAFQQQPLPDPQAPIEDLADWLDALREDTTVPYVTLLDDSEIAHTWDQLAVWEQYAVSPYSTRHMLGRPAAGHHRISARPEAPAVPTAVNGYPVVAAIAEREKADSWIVICRRTEPMPAWAADTAWYVTWRVWWADERWHAENGDYGPHHGLTWPKAQQSLLRRLNLAAPGPAAVVNPDVFLRADDEGDWFTCPTCHEPITMLGGGDHLGSLLTEIAGHRCPAADPDRLPDPLRRAPWPNPRG